MIQREESDNMLWTVWINAAAGQFRTFLFSDFKTAEDYYIQRCTVRIPLVRSVAGEGILKGSKQFNYGGKNRDDCTSALNPRYGNGLRIHFYHVVEAFDMYNDSKPLLYSSSQKNRADRALKIGELFLLRPMFTAGAL